MSAADRKLIPRREPPGYMRPPDGAYYLNVSLRTLRNWTRAGVIPCIRPGGGRVVLYAKTDLDRALARFREGVVS